MHTSTIMVLLAVGVLLVAVSILMRVRTAGKYEIRSIDLVFLIVPLMVVALVTGKIKGFDFFGVKADFSELLAAVAQAGIKDQIRYNEQLSVEDAAETVEMVGKGDVQESRVLIERRISALKFSLGHGGYKAREIKKYFEKMSDSSYLRVVVVNEPPDDKLFGIYDADKLIDYLRVAGDPAYAQFQQLLNSNSAANRAQLRKLPGFVGVESAVTSSTSKRDALKRMEDLAIDRLPVVNKDGFFMGTVGRARLTANLLLAVTETLEKQSSAEAGAEKQ